MGLPRVLFWAFRELWLVILILVVVGLAANDLAKRRPPPHYNIDHVLLDEQMKRSKSIEHADILVAGDSSGLMGVDPELLGELLGGLEVQVLSSLGNVGPAGNATLVRNATDRGLAPKAIVLLFHGTTMIRRFGSLYEEQVALTGSWVRNDRIVRARDALSQVAFGSVLDPLFPGDWADFYLNGRGLRLYMRDHKGAAIDPLPALPSAEFGSGQALVLDISVEARKSLRIMGTLLKETGVPHIYVGLSPIPHSQDGDLYRRTRALLLDQIARDASLPRGDTLALPSSLPDPLFVGLTHVNRDGREAYTRALASSLLSKL